MPVYDFQCGTCRKHFTVDQTLREHDARAKPPCPKCGSRDVERLIEAVHVQTAKKS